jgi:hypothetical protein
VPAVGDRHPVLRHTGRRLCPAFSVEAITACNGGTLVEDLEEKWVGVAERLEPLFCLDWTVSKFKESRDGSGMVLQSDG